MGMVDRLLYSTRRACPGKPVFADAPGVEGPPPPPTAANQTVISGVLGLYGKSPWKHHFPASGAAGFSWDAFF